jgi:zinc protease
MKRFIAILSFGVLAISGAAAQKPDAPKPAVAGQDAKATTTLKPLTAKEIIKRNRKANGSTLTAQKINTLMATGTFEIPAMGMTGAVEIYSKAPNKQMTVSVLKGLGTISEGFDGTEGWSQDPVSGLRTKTGAELARTRVDAIFDKDATLEKLYSTLETKGTEKVNGRDAYVIVATSSEAGTETWYFDAESFLLVRQDFVADSPQGKIPIQQYYDDFKPVSGVMTPYKVTSTNASYTAVITISEFKTNVAIDDAKFKKPAAQ